MAHFLNLLEYEGAFMLPLQQFLHLILILNYRFGPLLNLLKFKHLLLALWPFHPLYNLLELVLRSSTTSDDLS